jgi:hypothetical protein
MKHRCSFAVVIALVLSVAGLGCALPEAVRRSSPQLKEGWDRDAKGLRVLLTGPVATLWAASHIARYAINPPEGPAAEPQVKWFRYYDGPMESVDQVAILCHLDYATHITTIRKADERLSAPARYETWHYPACIEALEGEYEITVSYYSRKTVESGMYAETTTAESTTASTTQWHAESGGVYVLAAVVGKTAPAPGSGPAYKARRRTQELWETDFSLKVSHWQAAIVKLSEKADLDAPIKAHREAWRRYEDLR